ncbi:MAG TPA: glycosyltransferase family A protein [Acidimicrobiales bacterium]|nr:glycosyltransferase family A protein [Acidimicrobiales bacterium]
MSRVRVIVPAYQRSAWLEICLRSLERQDHPDFDVTIVDDASPDPAVSRVAAGFCARNDWQLRRNEERRYALHSRALGIDAADPQDDELVCLVDGDDWLAHAGALRALEAAFDDSVWLTSGGMRAVATVPQRARRAERWNQLLGERRRAFASHRDRIVEERLFRALPWCYAHPHVFRPHLWRAIDPVDFTIGGRHWIRRGSDMAYLYPMLELAGDHFRFLEDVHYIYNVHADNLDAEPRTRLAQEQIRRHLSVRAPYAPLPSDRPSLRRGPR